MSRGRRHVSVRTCVGCGERAPQHVLARVQLAQDGGFVTVTGPSRAGRSAYLHRQARCVDGVVRSRLLARSLRRQVDRTVREELVRRLRADLQVTKRDHEGGTPQRRP